MFDELPASHASTRVTSHTMDEPVVQGMHVLGHLVEVQTAPVPSVSHEPLSTSL
jgi:hypothetical protein